MVLKKQVYLSVFLLNGEPLVADKEVLVFGLQVLHHDVLEVPRGEVALPTVIMPHSQVVQVTKRPVEGHRTAR